jgi:hypothetical protein
MEKKRLTPNQKTSLLALRRETLRRLGNSELQEVAGAARVHIPLGYAEDTTPIYSYEDVP